MTRVNGVVAPPDFILRDGDRIEWVLLADGLPTFYHHMTTIALFLQEVVWSPI